MPRKFPSISLLLAFWALAGCFDHGARECEDRNCRALTYRLRFSDSAWIPIDTLRADSVNLSIMVSKLEYLAKTAAMADCESCAESFQGRSLTSDRMIRTAAGVSIPAGSNLLDPGIIGQVGHDYQSQVLFFQGTRFSRGRNTFTFAGHIDGWELSVDGSVWVPDSLGF